jgi:hypothetical protein
MRYLCKDNGSSGFLILIQEIGLEQFLNLHKNTIFGVHSLVRQLLILKKQFQMRQK